MQLLQNAKTNPYQSTCTEAHAIALGFFLTDANQNKKTFATIVAHLGCAFADLKNHYLFRATENIRASKMVWHIVDSVAMLANW